MARLNIEDSLFKDGRFTDLAITFGNRFTAIGAIVDLFTVAQEFYLKSENRMIPLSEFERRKCSVQTIEAGFAEIRDQHVYVFGSKEQFAWLLQKQEAGRKLSEKKSEQLKKARDAKASKNQSKTLNGDRTASERKLNGSEALSPTLPLSSFSDSGSSSDSNIAYAQKTKSFIARYCENFKAKYQSNPEIDGKTSGIAKRLAKDLTPEKINKYIDAYFLIPDAFLNKSKHPLNLLELKWNEVTVFANSGQFTTMKQAQQQDNQVAVQSQIERIKRGAL